MADIILTSAANWSTCNGGSAPGPGDSIYLNGTFALTLDGANNATYTCVLIRACVSASDTTGTSGTIALGAGTTTCTLNCNITAGSTTLLTIASGKHVTIIGTCTGGTSYSFYGCRVNSGGYLDYLGTAQGSANCTAVRNAGTVTTVTNAIGGAYGASGIENASAGTITTVTNAIGGTGDVACGINNYGIVASAVNAIGGSVAGAHGISTWGGSGTVHLALGGSANGAYGLLVTSYSADFFVVEIAQGGSIAGGNGVCYQSGYCRILGTELSGVGSPIGWLGLQMASGTVLSASATDSSPKRFYDTLAVGTDVVSSVAAAILATPANKLTTNASGFVTYANAAPPSASVIAAAVEAAIINDADATAVLQAITDKIASVNPSLAGLTIGAIASAVATALLATPANKLTTDSSGFVTYNNAAPLDASGTRAAIGMAAANLDSQLASLATSANLAAAKTILDHLATTIVLNDGVYQFTAGALALAPSTGGETTDWTADERSQIRDALGVDGDKTDAVGGSLAAGLAAVKVKTDQIGSVTVTYSSPTVARGAWVIYAGNDYRAADGRAITATVEGYSGPSLAGATVALRLISVENWNTSIATADMEVPATVAISGTAGDETVSLSADITSEQSAGLATYPPADARNYVGQFVAATSGGQVVTLTTGRMTVNKGIATPTV
jgi:hypothetical protein